MRYFIFLVCLFLMFGIATPVSLANLTLDTDFSTYTIGDIVTLTVRINTELQDINTIAAEVLFPSDILEFVDSNESDSVIHLWLDKPTYSGSSSIHFSGVTPGGFSTSDAPIISLNFRVRKIGQGTFTLTHISLLKNDGNASPAVVTNQSLLMSVNSGDSNNDSDVELPEHFVPVLVQDPDLFSGRNAVIFVTADKGSGIDHYEIKEGIFAQYVRATSPYELQRQDLDREISVKAIDREGNERVEVLSLNRPQPWSHAWKIIVTIVPLCALLLFYGYRLRRQNSSR